MKGTTGGATSYVCSLSTTWEWRKVMLRASVAPAGDQPPKASTQQFAKPRSWRRPLGITLTYRGGPECSWLVRSADKTYRFPGHVCLADMALCMAGLQ